MMIDLMRHNNEAEVMEEVNTSFTVQGRARFESKVENGSVFIKASYMRNMEPVSWLHFMIMNCFLVSEIYCPWSYYLRERTN